MTITSLLFVGYDLIYFGFAIYAFRLRKTDSNSRRRKGQAILGFGYSFIAGFPFGTVTKVSLAAWLDDLWPLISGFSVYAVSLLIIWGIGILCSGLGCYFIYTTCEESSGEQNNELDWSCCGFSTLLLLIGLVITIVTSLSLNSVATVIHILDHETNRNATDSVGYISFIWFTRDETRITLHMLVMWIPAILTTTLFVYITSKYGKYIYLSLIHI